MMPTLDQLKEQLAKLCPPASPPPPAQPATAAEPSNPPVAEPAPAVVSPSPEPCQSTDYAVKGFHLDVTVAPDQVVRFAEVMDENGFALDTVTGLDWLAQNEMEVVYDYFHPHGILRVAIRTRVPRDKPELPTISPVFPGANWHERETHDFFDIRFVGHPDLTPLLLPEDATYHPLKKDFVLDT